MSANQKRYAVKVEMYLQARNDQEAKVKSAQISKSIEECENDGYNVKTLEVEEAPVGSLTTRNVHNGNLTIFENKLIEW